MTVKRIILLILTIVALLPVGLALIDSINQPQVQSNLQLYQTNLILQASESLPQDSAGDLTQLRQALLGQDPDKIAENQYQEARVATQKNLEKLAAKLVPITSVTIPLDSKTPITLQETVVTSPQDSLPKEIEQAHKFINEVDLKIALLQAQQNDLPAALKNWSALSSSSRRDLPLTPIQQTAKVLHRLWTQPPQVLPDSEERINQTLKGWFRYRALEQLYQLQNRQSDLKILQSQEQESANVALIKLSIIGILPIFSGVIGFGILVFALVQVSLKKEQAILAMNQQAWEVPWQAETIWQVLIVGFFFVGQIVLPLLFGLFKLDLTHFSLRGKAIYVLVSYLAMSAGGLLVLYLSVKPFSPLPKDWFQFRLKSNPIGWGLGGYLAALPLVVLVSLINQQFWNGQGGSNPLLSLALEAQDKVVLAIFFFTASIAAPIYEEMMFRGFLLPSLTRYFPVWGAISASSLIFAVAHLNVSEILPLAVLGMVLGVVYVRSRNLLSSILLHSLWNSSTLISLFILGSGNA